MALRNLLMSARMRGVGLYVKVPVMESMVEKVVEAILRVRVERW